MNEFFNNFLYSFSFTLILIPIIVFFSHKLNLFDAPEFRKVHSEPTPRIGGLGIFTSFFATVLMLNPLPMAKKYLFLALLSFFIGFSDDLKTITYRIRLLLMFLVSVLFLVIFRSPIISIGFALPFWFGCLFTVFCITGFVNAFNIIDGLNGLSSGIALISTFSLFYISISVGTDKTIPMMLFTLTGAISAFFLINFFTGKIFLGDGGSYFLGFIIVMFSIVLASSIQKISPWFFIVINIYPVNEMLITVIRRIIKGKKPFKPDRMHFHHILLKVTKSHKLSTLLILIYSTIIVSIAFPIFNNTRLLISLYALSLFLHYIIYRLLLRITINFKNIAHG